MPCGLRVLLDLLVSVLWLRIVVIALLLLLALLIALLIGWFVAHILYLLVVVCS